MSLQASAVGWLVNKSTFGINDVLSCCVIDCIIHLSLNSYQYLVIIYDSSAILVSVLFIVKFLSAQIQSPDVYCRIKCTLPTIGLRIFWHRFFIIDM
jgi:hypothetical protein